MKKKNKINWFKFLNHKSDPTGGVVVKGRRSRGRMLVIVAGLLIPIYVVPKFSQYICSLVYPAKADILLQFPGLWKFPIRRTWNPENYNIVGAN